MRLRPSSLHATTPVSLGNALFTHTPGQEARSHRIHAGGVLQDATVTNTTHARNLAVFSQLGKKGWHAPGLIPPKLSFGTYISAFTTPRALLRGGRTRDRGRPHTLPLPRRAGSGCAGSVARSHTEGPLPPAHAVVARKANLVEGIVERSVARDRPLLLFWRPFGSRA